VDLKVQLLENAISGHSWLWKNVLFAEGPSYLTRQETEPVGFEYNFKCDPTADM
jgi:hypothetical protein